MCVEYPCHNRRTVFLICLVLASAVYVVFEIFPPRYRTPVVRPSTRSRNSTNARLPSNKVSIAYYTPLYGSRPDSHSTIFNDNLGRICETLDPEDYALADSVLVSLADLVHFPTSTDGISYRQLHPSQLWIFYAEESPRNSYATVDMKDITDLDHWFNLTATLKPESDFHIQYRVGFRQRRRRDMISNLLMKVYRIKPSIAQLLRDKLNVTLSQTSHLALSNPSDNSIKRASSYMDTLSSAVQHEFIARRTRLAEMCPYNTCNQALPSHLLRALQPYLPSIAARVFNRDVVYIAWFVSNCNTHSRREDYVKQLRSQAGIQIDIFGGCASRFHSPVATVPCPKESTGCMQKTLSNYQFYLSFENSKCDSYITEKYWIQGLNQHAIPIVLGASREQYQRLAVPHSYLHVDDYRSVEDLAQELHRLNQNESEYATYLQWSQIYDVINPYPSQPLSYLHTGLCFLGHYRRLHAMVPQTEHVRSLLARIRSLFDLTNQRLPNFDWTTARTKPVRISEFYNPHVNCWDAEYPSVRERIYNYFFTW